MASAAKLSSVPTGPQLDNRRVAAAGIDLAPLAAAFALAAAAGYLTLSVGVVLVGWTLYYFFALESRGGQTLGKRAMKLRVTASDGSPLTTRQVAMRTVVRVADGPVVGLVAMVASGERRQRLGDMAAGTVVTDASVVNAPAAPEEPAARLYGHGDLDPPTEPLAPSAEPAVKPKRGRKTLGGPEIRMPKLRMPGLSKGAKLSAPRLSVPKLRRAGKRAAVSPAESVAAASAPQVKHEAKPKQGRRTLGGPQLKVPGFVKKDLSFGRRKRDPDLSTPPAAMPARRESEPSVTHEAAGLPEPVQEAPPLPEVKPFDPFSDDAPEPEVEVMRPAEPDDEAGTEPEVSFDHVPDVEVVRPEPDASPAVEIIRSERAPEPEPEPEREPDFDIPPPVPQNPEPRVEHFDAAQPEAHEPQDEQPRDEDEEHVTVKPIDTVSAIDLVMQDAQEGEGDKPEPDRRSL